LLDSLLQETVASFPDTGTQLLKTTPEIE